MIPRIKRGITLIRAPNASLIARGLVDYQDFMIANAPGRGVGQYAEPARGHGRPSAMYSEYGSLGDQSAALGPSSATNQVINSASALKRRVTKVPKWAAEIAEKGDA